MSKQALLLIDISKSIDIYIALKDMLSLAHPFNLL